MDNNIKELILKNKKPSYQTTNGKEVRIRCPYCGDSRSDPTSAHMYIEVNPPFRFHCFKCETSGALTNQTLRDMGLFNNELSTEIVMLNKIAKSNNKIQTISTNKKRLLTNIYTDSFYSHQATEYFNKRYNLNLPAEFIVEKFKCILDPIDFFEKNRIFYNKNLFNYSESLGFISSDNSHLVFRCYGNSEKRYNNLAVSNNTDLSSKIYNIKTNISVMNPSINIVVTEGIFDIIGVYLHFGNNYDFEKTIFAAACGKSFPAVIMHYIRMGFLDISLDIYSDSDVNINFYKNMKKTIPYLKNLSINVYYNEIGKDYGVPLNQIKLKKIII